jgi:hypothetical protein
MKAVLLAAVALCATSGAPSWAIQGGDAAEAWIGYQYDRWWNERRSDLLEDWERHSYQPHESSKCLAVGHVWYCPATNTLAQQN